MTPAISDPCYESLAARTTKQKRWAHNFLHFSRFFVLRVTAKASTGDITLLLTVPIPPADLRSTHMRPQHLFCVNDSMIYCLKPQVGWHLTLLHQKCDPCAFESPDYCSDICVTRLRTYPRIAFWRQRVGHPGAEPGSRRLDGYGVADARQFATCWKERSETGTSRATPVWVLQWLQAQIYKSVRGERRCPTRC